MYDACVCCELCTKKSAASLWTRLLGSQTGNAQILVTRAEMRGLTSPNVTLECQIWQASVFHECRLPLAYQPYLCGGPFGKGTELIMQMRAGVFPLKSVTANFGSREGSRQATARQGCMSCGLGPEFGPGEVDRQTDRDLQCG